MNYRKSNPYPTKYHGKLREPPSILVMHTTEGGSKSWLDGFFAGQYKRGDGVNVSVHWCIYKDGEIVEYAPWRKGEAVACWHAGTSEWQGKARCNYWSLGYEMQHKAGETFPEAQIQAVLELHRMIKAEYPDIELVTHEQVAMPRGRKTDPTRPWKTAVWPRVQADWNKGEDMTPEEVEAIVRKVLSESTEVVHHAQHVQAAQQVLIEAGLLQTGRKTTNAASVSYVDLMLARVLDRLGPPPK